MMITTLIGVPASFLVALEHERLLTWMWGVAAVLNVALALVIVPRFGGMGAALTKVTVQIVTTAASLIALQRILHASFPWRSTLRFLLIGAVSFAPAGIASYYNSWMWLIPLAAGGLGLNLAALRWTGDFGTTEIDLVRHAFQLRTAAATRSS